MQGVSRRSGINVVVFHLLFLGGVTPPRRFAGSLVSTGTVALWPPPFARTAGLTPESLSRFPCRACLWTKETHHHLVLPLDPVSLWLTKGGAAAKGVIGENSQQVAANIGCDREAAASHRPSRFSSQLQRPRRTQRSRSHRRAATRPPKRARRWFVRAVMSSAFRSATFARGP